MESEFQPDVRIEEIPELRIVIADLPGFKREDLRVQVNNRGSLVICGERTGVKEIEEMTKVGAGLEKMQRAGHRFRKVISVPQTLNLDGVTASFGDERLRVTLPLLHISDQQNQNMVPAIGKPDQSLQSAVERSTPAGQEDLMKQPHAEDDKSATHPEAIRQDDDKEKPTEATAESTEMVEERKIEVPKRHFQGLVVSTEGQAVFEDKKQIQFPTSSSSTYSKRAVLMASSVLVLLVGVYITYKSRRRHHI